MLPQRVKLIPPPGDDFVCIALVPDVKDKSVPGRIVNPVQSYRKLDRPEIGGQVSACAGYVLNLKTPQFLTQCIKLSAAQPFYIFR